MVSSIIVLFLLLALVLSLVDKIDLLRLLPEGRFGGHWDQ